MLRRLTTTSSSEKEIRDALTQSSFLDRRAEEESVRAILADVRARGDGAVLEYTRRFDAPALTDLRVSAEEQVAARRAVSGDYVRAVEVARANIADFHQRQLRENWLMQVDGSLLGQVIRPLESVGVHVPGASAPLPSTLLMTVVPARVAGVERVIVCTPPQRDGSVDPHILVAAEVAGVDAVFKAAGAQAVGAMAYGTATIPRVDKIVGPGNIYAVLAKRLVFGHVAIEMLPGPTEVLILADETANPRYVAADLLSQAEHGEDSLAILLTPSPELADAVGAEIEAQVATLSRADTIRECLRRHGVAIVTRDLDEAVALADVCAPEHLELMTRDPLPLAYRLRHAGAIFIGEYSSEPVGDYIAGPSHVLPTGGTARFSSPLNVDDFLKKTSLIAYSRRSFEAMAPHVLTLAETETLDAHANAIRVRLEGERRLEPQMDTDERR
jgi:histidinol dehydrogenase